MNAKSAYRESAMRGATSVGLVVMLYEQAVQDLQRALEAMKENNVERRAAEIDHAMRVLGQLQGTLDKERGGEIARNLERFYELARASMITAQAQSSPEILRRRIADLLELREAWIEVDRRTSQPWESDETAVNTKLPANLSQAVSRGSWQG